MITLVQSFIEIVLNKIGFTVSNTGLIQSDYNLLRAIITLLVTFIIAKYLFKNIMQFFGIKRGV